MSSFAPATLAQHPASDDRNAEPLSALDQALIAELQSGLPLVPHPYRALAERVDCDEQTVIARIQALLSSGVFKRFGVVVRHHELGYRANGMVVWDVPDERVAHIGALLAQRPEVRLCYRRPRCLPDWPYNLFCMIHGRDREEVSIALARLIIELGLDAIPHEVLFSTHRFKQRGARYRSNSDTETAHV